MITGGEMKKFFCALIIIVCAGSFFACTDDSHDLPDSPPPISLPNETPKNDEETPGGGSEKNDEWFDVDL